MAAKELCAAMGFVERGAFNDHLKKTWPARRLRFHQRIPPARIHISGRAFNTHWSLLQIWTANKNPGIAAGVSFLGSPEAT
jgi:hypothetical protein